MVNVRVTGRMLRPGCLATRRFFLGTLGVACIKVPRSQNPYALARRIRRYLLNQEIEVLQKIVRSRKASTRAGGTALVIPEGAQNDDDVAAAE